jgi:hypothetical protein
VAFGGIMTDDDQLSDLAADLVRLRADSEQLSRAIERELAEPSAGELSRLMPLPHGPGRRVAALTRRLTRALREGMVLRARSEAVLAYLRTRWRR